MKQRIVHELRRMRAARAQAGWPVEDLFGLHGFSVFPGLLHREEAHQLASSLAPKRTDKPKLIADVARRLPASLGAIVDPRVVRAVEGSISAPAKFLQASDFTQNRNSTTWHRDSPCRRFGSGGDWDSDFACVKAILYLEGEQSLLSLVPGSHRWPRRMWHTASPRRVQELDAREGIKGPLYEDGERAPRPVLLRVRPGDCVIFDTRLLHRGQSVELDGRPGCERFAPGKTTLNLCYGRDNLHSRRFFSYYRYLRPELGYAQLPDDAIAHLEQHDLLLSAGLENLFRVDPDQASGVCVKTTRRFRRFREQIGPLSL